MADKFAQESKVGIDESAIDPRRQEKFINEMKINKSLKLWEYNIDTGELDEVSVETFISMQKKTGKLEAVRKDEATWNERSMYFQALNKKNAARKVIKMLKNSGFDVKVTDD